MMTFALYILLVKLLQPVMLIMLTRAFRIAGRSHDQSHCFPLQNSQDINDILHCVTSTYL